MKAILTPLPVQIPKHYAAKLGIDPTFLYRVNLGKQRLSVAIVNKLLTWARKDPELAGLCLEHLRPEKEIELYRKHLRKKKPHAKEV